MSDFLTNLTARSLGVAPNLLRPELPSLFESPKGSAPILEEGASLDAYEESSAVSSVPSGMAKHPNHAPRSIRESDHGSVSHKRRGIEAEPNRSSPQTIVPYELAKQIDASTRIRYQNETMIEPTVRVVKSLEQQQPTITPRLEQQIGPLSEQVDQARVSQEEVSPSLVPVVPNLESVPPLSEMKKNSDEQIFPSDHPSSVVRINIGRIEVRAVTQPPIPTRSVPPARPKMTLDEYLRDRNKGRG